MSFRLTRTTNATHETSVRSSGDDEVCGVVPGRGSTRSSGSIPDGAPVRGSGGDEEVQSDRGAFTGVDGAGAWGAAASGDSGGDDPAVGAAGGSARGRRADTKRFTRTSSRGQRRT